MMTQKAPCARMSRRTAQLRLRGCGIWPSCVTHASIITLSLAATAPAKEAHHVPRGLAPLLALFLKIW